MTQWHSFFFTVVKPRVILLRISRIKISVISFSENKQKQPGKEVGNSHQISGKSTSIHYWPTQHCTWLLGAEESLLICDITHTTSEALPIDLFVFYIRKYTTFYPLFPLGTRRKLFFSELDPWRIRFNYHNTEFHFCWFWGFWGVFCFGFSFVLGCFFVCLYPV